MADQLGRAATQQQWPKNSKSKNSKLSAGFIEIQPSSMLYSMLPSSVKNRLPRLPSLRKSVTTSSQKGRVGFTGLNCRRRSTNSNGSSSTGSGMRMPPPAYSSALTISTAIRAGSSDVNNLEYLRDQLVASDMRPSKDPECGPLCLFGTGTNIGTNIDWKFAAQGKNLLSSAVEESLSASRDESNTDPPFTRQLYIHSMTYLLRGLPNDLSTEERLSLQSALPPGVVEPLRLNIDNQNVVTIHDFKGRIPNRTSSPPSLLHRILASLVIQLFVFARFILPHIKALLRNAYIYERNNRISEKMLAKGIDTVDTVGKKGIEFGEAVARIGDGKLGQALNEVAVWCAEGVAGGIYEGVGEGMVIISAKNQKLTSDARL